MSNMKPTTLKGFKDYFAQDVEVRDFVINTFKKIAKGYGFEGLETPALEYSELILGQSGEEAEKLYYRFRDHGDRDVMLRYEVMIPMCRAVAQNINNIVFPYKRYQIQNVWRADNVQKGRCREFTQMDIDTLGVKDTFADAEIITMGIEFLRELGFSEFQARINNRKILQGILEYLNLDNNKFEDFYIAIDKIKKIGGDGVKDLLLNKGFSTEEIDSIINILKVKELGELEETIGKSVSGKEGIEEIKSIFEIFENTDLDSSNYLFDITLARGLASYTGPIWEFEVLDGNVGSVSGGGRYDKAVSKYIGREIPATGTSFGLERLMEIIKDRKMLDLKNLNKKVVVIPMSKEAIEYTTKITKELRKRDIACLTCIPEQKLSVGLSYANKKQIPWVIIIGEDEMNSNTILLKNMLTSEQIKITPDQIVEKIII